MAIIIDQDVRLDEKPVRRRDNKWRSKLYPLQIPVYHHLTVHIYQSTSEVFELSGVIPLATGEVSGRNKTPQVQTDSYPYAP